MADAPKAIYHGSATNFAATPPPPAPAKPFLADVNPAKNAVEVMLNHALHLKDYQELPPPSRNADLRDRVARLEHLLQLTLDSLNGATIICDGSGNVVLTLPDLPT